VYRTRAMLAAQHSNPLVPGTLSLFATGGSPDPDGPCINEFVSDAALESEAHSEVAPTTDGTEATPAVDATGAAPATTTAEEPEIHSGVVDNGRVNGDETRVPAAHIDVPAAKSATSTLDLGAAQVSVRA
jgi:hypothetical protein